MSNCLVAQSGGPTAVINASVAGICNQCLSSKAYGNVFAGINGIEGILHKKFINLSKLSLDQIELLKYTPSSALGSCRYKLKDFNTDDSEYKKFFSIMEEYDINTFFYIGGNDSMDTVKSLSLYSKLHNLDVKIIGIPKTIDNDLMCTDHCPGFGSAAKFIATSVLENYLDSSVYINNGVFILETMGRDTGWLAASSILARIENRPVVDFIYVPELPFNKEYFLEDVKDKLKKQNQVFIVTSEGIKDENGTFLGESTFLKVHDKFGHAQLGGVSNYLKQIIIDNEITSRVKTLELGTFQRCSMHYASQTDIDEAYMVGEAAVKYAQEDKSGFMVGIQRHKNSPYSSGTFLADPSEVANHIKYLPSSWITKRGNFLTNEAFDYINPLILGTPSTFIENGLPKYLKLNKLSLDL